MSEHMLQSAWIAEQAEETDSVIVAALLHDIGHYTSEFDEGYIGQGVDNEHEISGASILAKHFPPEVVEAVRCHVDAKRYLCAVEPSYFTGLSEASVQTLALQGGPMQPEQVRQFAQNPWLDTILRVRRYDDGAKVVGCTTPDAEHYLQKVEQLLNDYAAAV